MKIPRDANKSQAIRDILKEGPQDIYALQEKIETRLNLYVGRQALKTLLSVMQTNDGDVQGSGRGQERVYALVQAKQRRAA